MCCLIQVIVTMVVLAFLSLAFTSLLTMFDVYGWKRWNLKDFLLLRSFQIRNSFMVWSVADSRNASVAIDMQYGTNISATTVTLGVTCEGFCHSRSCPLRFAYNHFVMQMNPESQMWILEKIERNVPH